MSAPTTRPTTGTARSFTIAAHSPVAATRSLLRGRRRWWVGRGFVATCTRQVRRVSNRWRRCADVREAAGTAVLSGSVVTAVAVLAVMPRPAWAQVPDPAPDASLPGGALITQVLGWLKYAAIAAAVAGLLIGGVATGVGHFGSSYSASLGGQEVGAGRDRRGDDRRARAHDRHDRLQRDADRCAARRVYVAAIAVVAVVVVIGLRAWSTPGHRAGRPAAAAPVTTAPRRCRTAGTGPVESRRRGAAGLVARRRRAPVPRRSRRSCVDRRHRPGRVHHPLRHDRHVGHRALRADAGRRVGGPAGRDVRRARRRAGVTDRVGGVREIAAHRPGRVRADATRHGSRCGRCSSSASPTWARRGRRGGP